MRKRLETRGIESKKIIILYIIMFIIRPMETVLRVNGESSGVNWHNV